MSKRRRPAAARRMAEQRFWGLNRTAPAGQANGDGPPPDGDTAPVADGAIGDGATGDGATGAGATGAGATGDRATGDGAAGAGPATPAVALRRIRPTSDPAAVVRSLGPPPMALDSALVERHLTAVYEEAVRAATALAAATGLLAADDSSDSGDPD